MNANTLYDAFAKISDSLTDTAYEAKKPERTKNFKTIAIAAAALVVAAAAIFAIPAFRSDPNNVSAVEDTSEVDDSNVLYRSENGDYTVWKVNPDSLSGFRSAALWAPVNDEMLHRASDVVVGTIKDITDIYIETGDHDYLETKHGVIDLSEVGRYKSLVTVEVKETINGDIAEGETITFVYDSPLASYPKNISSSLWGDESAIVGRDYVFFLKKTSEKDYKFDLTPIAAYAYGITGPCFVPYDEPQNASLLETIGAQIGTCGEEFIEAVRKYYN